MPVNKNAVIRYNVLDKCLSNFGRRYFIADLLEEVNGALLELDPNSTGIQRRQLFADFNFMKSEAGYAAPIESYREGKKAYYRYEDPVFSINKSPLNQVEADHLKSALAILQRFEGSPEFEWVNEIGPMLREQFGLKDSEEKIIGYDSNIDYTGYEYIAPLFNTISNKRVLDVEYKTFEGEEFNFEFHPYYLKQYNNRWFVLGLNTNTEVEQWIMPLDRIASIKEVDSKYIPNRTDWEDYFYDFIGVTKMEGDIQEVQLKFSADQAPYVRTKPIHPSQRMEGLEDGELLVKLKVIPNYELERLILSFGEGVEILRPESLRDKIQDRIARTADKYKN